MKPLRIIFMECSHLCPYNFYMDKKLLTTQETAELLGLSDGRIRRMILDGIIPAQKFGRVNMIKKSDAEKIKVHGKVGRPKKTDKPPKK